MLKTHLGFTSPTYNKPLLKESLNVLFVGQSNISKMFEQYNSAGSIAFANEARKYFQTVVPIKGAKDGAAVHYDANRGPGSYLNATNDDKGIVYTNRLETNFASSGVAAEDIHAVVIGIGEADMAGIKNGHITEAEHKAAMNTFIDILKTDFPNALMIIIPRGVATDSNDFQSYGEVKRAQWEIAQERTDVIFGPSMIDLPVQADGYHLDQTGLEIQGERAAKLIAYLLGKKDISGIYGPRMTGIRIDQAQNYVYVDIAHADGTDLTISAKDGFICDINGTAKSPLFVTRDDATTIRMRHKSIPAQPGQTIKILWDWGTLQNYDRTTILLDNTGRTLEPDFELTDTL